MIKLQDFAKQCGVTDRAIQKHLKKHEQALAGHFQRRGKNGTWLDETAQEFIRSLMIQTPPAVIEADPRVADLEAALKDLWDQSKKKDETIGRLVQQNEDLRLQAASVARLEADNAAARQKVIEAEGNALAARDELEKARQEAEELRGKLEDLRRKGLFGRILWRG